MSGAVRFDDTYNGGAFYSPVVWGYRRWGFGPPGTWTVCFESRSARSRDSCLITYAVVDDFGNLLRVPQ